MKKDLILLSGFLGSGKTTILHSLLRRQNAEAPGKLAVLLNDFGAVPVDGTLVQDAVDAGNLLEIGGGSVFCSCLKEAFVKALFTLTSSSAERVFVEASGMSDPSGVTRTLELAGLAEAYSRPLVICLFDPVKSLKLSRVLEVISRQIVSANVVVLTKADISTRAELDAARAWITSIRPDVLIVESANGRFHDNELTLESLRGMATAGLSAPFGFNTPENRPDSFTIDRRITPLPEGLLDALKAHPAVLRIKGYALTTQGAMFISDTGRDGHDEATPAMELSPVRDMPVPLTVICMQDSGRTVQNSLKPFGIEFSS